MASITWPFALVSLRHIETLQAIAAAGSLVQAASALNVTPAALTARVKGFEEAVALKLFDRTASGMRRTKAADRECLKGEETRKRRAARVPFEAALGSLRPSATC